MGEKKREPRMEPKTVEGWPRNKEGLDLPLTPTICMTMDKLPEPLAVPDSFLKYKLQMDYESALVERIFRQVHLPSSHLKCAHACAHTRNASKTYRRLILKKLRQIQIDADFSRKQ